jgi:hypothetical protein
MKNSSVLIIFLNYVYFYFLSQIFLIDFYDFVLFYLLKYVIQ